MDTPAPLPFTLLLRPRVVATPTRAAEAPERHDFQTRLGALIRDLPESSWLIFDSVFLAIGLRMGYAWVGVTSQGYGPAHLSLAAGSALLISIHVLASLVFGLYERETLWSRARVITRTFLVTTATLIITSAAVYVLLYATISRRVLMVATAFYLVTSIAGRLSLGQCMRQVKRGVLVIGPRGLYESLREARFHGQLWEYDLVGYLSDRPEDHAPAASGYRGSNWQLDRLFSGHAITDIVVSSDLSHDPDLMGWVTPHLEQGCRVTNEATFYEKATGQILLDRIRPDWFLSADLEVSRCSTLMLKRLFDMAVAVVGLLVSLPVAVLIALCIKLNDRGPVFYSQWRVGRHGQIFRLYKFRTMRPNAESAGSVWARQRDDRVTRVGGFLRKARLDELPQLWNVLMGRMSIVGPRPERPDIVDDLCHRIPYYDERHLVKPGLSGWAQINYHYGATVEDARRKLQYDLYYLKNMSLELDLVILLRTLGTFLRGAR